MISIIKQKDIENSINNNLGNNFIQFVFGKTSPNRIHSEFIGLGSHRANDIVIHISNQEGFDNLVTRQQIVICDVCDQYPQILNKMVELGIKLHV